jgi:hypothetical protein
MNVYVSQQERCDEKRANLAVPSICKEAKMEGIEDDIKCESLGSKELSTEPAFAHQSIEDCGGKYYRLLSITES